MSNEPQPPEGGIKLLEGFEVLREATSPKVWSAGLQREQLLPGPSALEAVARRFDKEAKEQSPLGRPQFDLEEARKQWQRYLATRDSSQIELRALRRLCWDPEVAATTEFLHLIEGYNRPPSALMILGLLGVYHLLWGSRKDDLEHQVTKWLRDYRGYNPILLRLAEVDDEVVGPHAATRTAARHASDENESARTLLTQRGLALNTPYASAVAEALLNLALRKLERNPDLREVQHFCEKVIPADRDILPLQVFANAVKGLVRLTSSSPTDSALRDVVKNFTLLDSQLGDPRRHLARWDNMRLSSEAETVKGWLSEEDLKFFFDLIMEGQEDRHRRRDFWLRYVPRVRNSRVALGETDRQRLRLQLEDLKKRGRTYATLDDWSASAFVMDFGPVIVVEFSQTGNACSVHEAKVCREKIGDLQANRFYKARLKKPFNSPGWFRHDSVGRWMREVQQHLALFGVRE